MLYGRLPTTRSRSPGSQGQVREVHLQHVGLQQLDARNRAPERGQVAVQFDQRQACTADSQWLGQRAAPRADFDDALADAGIDRAHDRIDHR